MPNQEVEINSTKLQIALRVFPQQLKFELADAMDHISRSFFKKFYAQRLSGPPGITARAHGIFHRFQRRLEGEKIGISNRSTTTARTAHIMADSSISPLDMKLEVYTNSKAAGIHERGGTITSGGYMPIPLSSQTQMFKQSGSLKENYLLKNMSGKLTLVRIRGQLYLAQVNKARHTTKLYFILKKSIRIRARLGFYASWGNMENRAITLLNKAVDNTLEKT